MSFCKGGFRKPLVLSLGTVLLCAFFVTACSLGDRKAIEIGIQKTELKDGTLEIIVTARASEHARAKNSPAMMRSTSCRAARDLLAAEMQKQGYANRSRNFATLGLELLDRGEYCRILAHYNSRGLPKAVRQRSVDLEKIR